MQNDEKEMRETKEKTRYDREIEKKKHIEKL